MTGCGTARHVEITWMVGLRRRCAPRNDGGGSSLSYDPLQ